MMPPWTSRSVIRRRPTRPFPSRNGWIVSNCAWATPAWTRAGSGPGSWRNRSRSPRDSSISCGGGGTKLAFWSDAPDGPIQFWLRRNSPGLFSAPRTPVINRSWTSRIRRRDRGRLVKRSRP